MPLKSKAQIRKWGELVKEGKISQEKFDEAISATPKKLPERVGPKKVEKVRSLKQLQELANRKK